MLFFPSGLTITDLKVSNGDILCLTLVLGTRLMPVINQAVRSETRNTDI